MKLFVIKIGGNVIDDEAQLSSFIKDIATSSGNKILVHGGGKIATDMSKQLGIESKMVDGRRITDAETLKIVQMVYAGLINKNIVARLQADACNAIGMTGADANIILAHKRILVNTDYGYVGDIDKVDAEKIALLIDAGLLPVMAPLTHDGKGQLLNTNADTIAASVATALSKKYEVTLVYCFEKSGVLKNMNDENSVIAEIKSSEYYQLKQTGVISKGMIPKLDNSFDAIKSGIHSVIICHAKNLKKIILGENIGTRLVP